MSAMWRRCNPSWGTPTATSPWTSTRTPWQVRSDRRSRKLWRWSCQREEVRRSKKAQRTRATERCRTQNPRPARWRRSCVARGECDRFSKRNAAGPRRIGRSIFTVTRSTALRAKESPATERPKLDYIHKQKPDRGKRRSSSYEKCLNKSYSSGAFTRIGRTRIYEFGWLRGRENLLKWKTFVVAGAWFKWREDCRRKAIHSQFLLHAGLNPPIDEDSLAPNCGVGGSRCNEGV